MKKTLFFTLFLLLVAATQAQQPVLKGRHTLTISYLYDSAWSIAAPAAVLTLETNDPYSVTSPTISGYTPDKPVVEGRMPDYDVFDTVFYFATPGQLPEIEGEITAPDPICAGNALQLTDPKVNYATSQGWEMYGDNIQMPEPYTGQTLDVSYNGWHLRYWASNDNGMVYSNTVTITVHSIEPVLTGDQNLCTLQTGTYTVVNVGNTTLTWTVSDSIATLTESGKTLKVKWASAGNQTVTLTAENEATGCSATVELSVTVVSYVDSSDLHDIVAKKHEGRDYILIYPNPQATYKYQWYKDGEAIKGATGQYLYQEGGLDNGVYNVYLSFNADAQGNLFGGAFSGKYTVTAPATISLCPNPAHANDEFRIINENGGEVTVSIYTLDGRLVHRQTVSGTNAALHLSLSPGLYLVKMNDIQNEYNEKLIVK